MGHVNTVWGKLAKDGIEVAVQDFLADRRPMHGGVLVDQANTLSGRIFRASDGWIIELCNPFGCDACVYIGCIGSSVVRRAEIELFTHVGCMEPTEQELQAAARVDMELEEKRRAAAVDAELDALFDRIAVEYFDAPSIEVASCCSACECELDIRKFTARLSDGRLLCERCVYTAPSSQPSAA